MKHLSFLSILCIVLLCGCGGARNLVYFSDLANETNAKKIDNQPIKIQQKDVLRINVSSQSQESNVLFANNTGVNVSASEFAKGAGQTVNKNGEINFPVLGNVKVEGLTVAEAQDMLSMKLVKYVKTPIVDVQIVNFKVTVIGEVNHPSSFTISGDGINLLEALGMAGDMTVYGKRNNVLIIREENGNRIMKRLNLNSRDVLNSPYFTLKQNDIVYVEPDKSKSVEFSSNTRTMPIVIASLSAVALLISSVLNR
ncbi:Polysaccharide biosynthesis/export protein [compost metagenome]|uniref:polysaccharide biosynthesis/export family protein n=1 Tax=Pedobacter ghigonis TaxID=2730403 RepID=UPI000FB5E635|nr:polysaccharide biosynthesis/export family protein [Pedobacter ghigonis]